MTTVQNKIPPIYMYAGGKTKLLKKYEEVFPDIKKFDNYVEPFFGGGAVWGWVLSHKKMNTHIGDVNSELMGMLQHVASNRKGFISRVTKISDTYLKLPTDKRKEWYYDLRKKYWNKPDPATLFILMRLGFNGIWQTCKDSKGLFGTPAGLLNHKNREQIFLEEKINKWADALQTVSQWNINSYEFMTIPEGNKTLVYLDPPYRDSFTTYGTGFSDEDQIVLSHWMRSLIEKGNKVILANRCVEGDRFFEKLLEDVCDFHYFDVVYTAGRRKKVEGGHEAKPAVEFIAISK